MECDGSGHQLQGAQRRDSGTDLEEREGCSHPSGTDLTGRGTLGGAQACRGVEQRCPAVPCPSSVGVPPFGFTRF